MKFCFDTSVGAKNKENAISLQTIKLKYSKQTRIDIAGLA